MATVALLRDRPVAPVRFFEDGEALVSLDADSRLTTWDLEHGPASVVARAHDDVIWEMAIGPDDDVFTIGEGRTIKRWRLHYARLGVGIGPAGAVRLSDEGELDSYALSRDGRKAAISYRDGRAEVLRIVVADDTITLARELELPQVAPRVVVEVPEFSADGRLLALSYSDSTVRIYKRSEQNETTARWDGLISVVVPVSTVRSLRFAPDGRTLALASRKRNQVVLMAADTGVRTGAVIARLEVDWAAGCLAWTADSRYLAASSRDGWVSVWEAPDYERIWDFPAHDNSIRGLTFFNPRVFDKKDHRLVTGSDDGHVRLWDLVEATAEGLGAQALLLADYAGSRGEVKSVQFTEDERTLVAAGGREGKFGEIVAWTTGGDLERSGGE